MAMGPTIRSESRSAGRRGRGTLPLTLVFVALCLEPHLTRLRWPSLFSDDVIRIAHLQTMPLRGMLVRPFNEHLAPLFELVSWLTWHLAGERLGAAAVAFTLASFLPFGLCLLALGALARRELGSTTSALAVVAAVSLSAVHVETVWWYSASSFTWALLGTLLAWRGVLFWEDATGRKGRIGGGMLALMAALAAPACSAIGLIAGPLAALRALNLSGRRGRDRLVIAALAIVGTLLYLTFAAAFRYRDVLTESVARNADPRTGFLSICRGPIDVLLPGLLGMGNIDRFLSGGRDLALFGLGGVAALVLAWRSPRRRPVVLGGLGLILGGYGLTYPFRTVHGPHWILEVQRYHLLPQVGLVLVLAAALRPWLARFDANPRRAWLAGTALAALLLLAHRAEMRTLAKFYRFPEQARTLAALDHLETVCRSRGISRAQALAALDPIRTRWFPHDYNALMMLAETVPAPTLPNDQVRPTLLAALSPDEREALCGGMDVSPHLRAAGEFAGARNVAVGRLVEAYRARPEGPPGHYVAAGGPAFWEFALSPPTAGTGRGAEPRVLCVPGVVSGGTVELWWADDSEAWSESRSVRWQPDPAHPVGETAVLLERLPHWGRSPSRRVRVIVRSEGPVGVELKSPRLLR